MAEYAACIPACGGTVRASQCRGTGLRRLKTQQRRWVNLQPGTTWPGDAQDFVRLLSSVGAHCTCRHSPYLAHGFGSCPAHQLLAEQYTLDHLVYGRRMRDRFVRSEWTVETPESDAVYRRLLRRLTQRGHPRRLTERITWRPGALSIGLAGLLLLAGLSGTVHPAASAPARTIGSWQTR